jgi:para-nitrobenzyl esterase
VYLYEVGWQTSVDGSKWKTPHSVARAFVFDNVVKLASTVGTGPEARQMADQMSACWLAFARSGDPNNATVSHWPTYGTSQRATMVFDLPSKVLPDFRGAERKLLASLPPKPPG